jgi:hypothetical protein
VTKIAEGGAPRLNAGRENLKQGLSQQGEPPHAQAVSWGLGTDPGGKQALIGINVAHTGHQGLIE